MYLFSALAVSLALALYGELFWAGMGRWWESEVEVVAETEHVFRLRLSRDSGQ